VLLLAIGWLTAHPHRAQKLNSVSTESSAIKPLVDIAANDDIDEKIEIVAIAA
jgi:hypothetical protein